MTIKTQNITILFLCYLGVFFLVLFNINNGFFWDTVVYGSYHSNFYWSTHYSSLLLPDSIDCGVIPTFGIYIAFVWGMFGRSIQTSHLAMLPFVLGIVWQLYILCKKFIPIKFAGIATILVLVDSSILSQVTLVSPDVPLIFFFILAINSLKENRKLLLTFSILFLFMTSTRGVLVSFSLLLLDLYCNIDFKNKWKEVFITLMKRSLIYLPALTIFIVFNFYHYIQKGWIFTHEDSPWANTQKVVNGKEFLFNIGLLGWRMLDYGKVIVWLIFIGFIVTFKKQTFKLKATRLLFFYFFCILLFVHLDMLWANNLLAHRYFIPLNIILSLLVSTVLFSDLVGKKLKYLLSFLWFTILISGNFWIYPPKIAQGWDSTLAHLPYYNLRHEAIDYLNQKKINFKEVGTFFPNTASFDKIDLNNDNRNFDNFDKKKTYVFYSNVYNIDDNIYEEITDENKYTPIKKFKNKGIYIIIYKKI